MPPRNPGQDTSTLTPQQLKGMQQAQYAPDGNVPLPQAVPQGFQTPTDSSVPNPSQQTVTPLTREQSIQQLRSVA